MGHNRLSPSSAHRWVRCPGSIREETKYPDESNKYSIDGTHTHTLLEKAVQFGICNDNRYNFSVFDRFINHELNDHEGKFVVDKDRCDRVQVAIDYIDNVVRETGCYVRSESKYPSSLAFGRDDMGGTTDLILHCENYFEIIDYKDGVGYVSPENNDQMIIYSLNAFKHAHPHTYRNVENIILTIIQPKNINKGMMPVQSWSFPVEWIDALIHDYKVAAQATDDPDAPLIAGESQCKWCKHRGNCEVKKEFVMEKAGLQTINFLPDLTDQAAQKDAAVMSDEKLKEIKDAAPLIKAFLEDVDKEIYRRVESGVNKDYKLVQGRGSRSWAFDEDKMSKVFKKMGVPKTAMFETKFVTPAKAEKLSWQAKSKGQEVNKCLSKRQLETLKSEYVNTVAGKPTLAPIDDPRPALITDASSLFKAVESQPQLPSWLTGGN